jgi:hypothetical protein
MLLPKLEKARVSGFKNSIEEAHSMALQKGERYRCPDASCGCEIEVTKAAQPGSGGNLNPRCCCGKEMQRV